MNDYEQFLKRKEVQSINAGFSVDKDDLNKNLFPFQRDIVAWALQKGKASVFTDCGSGKTIIQLEFADKVCKKTGGTALIVAPLSVAEQTKREGEKKFGITAHVVRDQNEIHHGAINITNYEILNHFDPDAFNCVVLDECFAPDTKIETVGKNGEISEKEIKDVSIGDYARNCTGASKVLATRKKKVEYAVRVGFNGRKVICSPRHPFFTARGWVCAKELQEGEILISTDQAMRILRKPVSGDIQVGQKQKILQQVLLCEMENETAGCDCTGPHKGNTSKDREESVGLAQKHGGWAEERREDSESEPHEQPSDERKSIEDIKGDAPRTFKAWGKWERPDIATAVDDGCIARELEDGTCYLTGQETARIPNELQSRLSELREENCDRVGWELPLFEKRARQEEGRKTGFFRLESFEILEQGSRELDKYRDADGQLYFYDIEIERHPSFTVNGCLVHNSSILKSFTSATRNELIDSFAGTPYKLCCTATPSPNDFTELGNHAEFMGIMRRTEMLATYFIHDGSDTSKWRLKGYGEKKFWEWVATWAICMRTPKDLGYSDDGYALPPLNIIEHTVPSEAGECELFARRAETLSERREARKESQGKRILEAKKLVEESDEQWLVWCDYNSESEELHKAIDGSVEVVGADSPEFKAQQAIDFVDGKTKCLVSKSSIYGMGLNFQNCHNIIYCGISDSFESFYQSVRRCWRYGQEHEVNAHIIISEKELNVLDNIKRKEAQMNEMQSNMIALMHDVTMSEIQHATRITTEYKPKERMIMPKWIA